MTTNRRLAALLVAVALTTVLAGPAVASPSIDTSTTDHTTTVSEFQPGSANNVTTPLDNRTRLEIIASNGSTPVLDVVQNTTGLTVAANDSATNITTDPMGSTESPHFNLSFDNEAIADTERDINDNVSLHFNVYNESNKTDDAWVGNSTYKFYLDNGNESSVEVVTENDTEAEDGDIATLSDGEGFGLGDLDNPLSRDKTVIQEDDIEVDGDNTEIVYINADDGVQDDLERVSGTDFSVAPALGGTADSGQLMSKAPVRVTDGDTTAFIEVAEGEAPDGVDEDDDTYAVHEDVGGEDAVVLHLGEDFEDSDEVDVRMTYDAGFIERFTTYNGWRGAV